MKMLLRSCIAILSVAVILLAVSCGGGGNGNEENTSDGTSGVKVSGDVQVPILIDGASNVGSFDMVLEYDATVLQAMEVVAGSLAQNAMIEYKIRNAGQVVIGIVDSSGITGDGSVAMIRFKLLNSTGTSPLTLQKAESHDATTLVDIISQTTNGSVSEKGNLVSSPVVKFST